MTNLGEKIDKYADELFTDLGLVDLPEDQRADIFARIEERFEQVVISEISDIISISDRAELKQAFDEQDYEAVERVLNRYPQRLSRLEHKVDLELNRLKDLIAAEQKNVERAGTPSGT